MHARAEPSSVGVCMQVDYAQAALFLNISAHVSGSAEGQVAWWQHSELRMKNGLDPRTQARPPCAAVSSPHLLSLYLFEILSFLHLGCPLAFRPASHMPMSVCCMR